jgi:methanogenic corrinoid protein MtbC1
MVGGPVFLDRPELAALVGADASAVDARQAALQAESLLALAARRA